MRHGGRTRRVNLARLDLNLVVALRALLEERKVTRAGQRVGLSRPAMSAALARLRKHFDDDLLARVGGHYELTALGRVLLDRTATAYDVLERLFASRFRSARREPGIPPVRLGLRRRRLRRGTGPRRTPGGPRHPAAFHTDAARGGRRHRHPAQRDRRPAHAPRRHQRLPRHRPVRRSLGVPRGREPPGRRRNAHPRGPGAAALGHLPAHLRRPGRTATRHARRRTARRGLRRQFPAAAAPGRGHPPHRPGAGPPRPAAEAARRRACRGTSLRGGALREALWWHPVHTHEAAHIWLRETAARVGERMGGTHQV